MLTSRPLALVTLTRYADIFATLDRSIEQYELPELRRIVVTSGEASATIPYDGLNPAWQIVDGVEPFIFARNANLGLEAAGAEADVVLINDDCELVGPTTRMLRAVYQGTGSTLGLLAPQIRGGVGTSAQREGYLPSIYGTSPRVMFPITDPLRFVCVYLPATTRLQVGELDEQFTGYGGEDVDYCRRVRAAGLELGITPMVIVRHGYDGAIWSSSYARLMSRDAQLRSMADMNRRLDAKYRTRREVRL